MIAILLGTAAVVTLLVVVGLLVDRKLPILPRAGAPVPVVAPAPAPVPAPVRPSGYLAGETAATAVQVPPSWRDKIAAGRCGCGKPLAVASDEAIRFADRPLVVVRLACAACGHGRSVYLEPVAA